MFDFGRNRIKEEEEGEEEWNENGKLENAQCAHTTSYYIMC